MWAQRWWGGGIILKIMLGLVPVRFLFGASATFSDIFNRDRVCMCGAEAAVCMKAPYPAPFSCSKHSSFLYCSSGCFHLKKHLSKETLHFSCQEDERLSENPYPQTALFLPSPHQSASQCFSKHQKMPRVCMRPQAKWQVRLFLK